MVEEKDQVRMILVTLFMIFISGCWTLATIIPLSVHWTFRSMQLVTVTVANISFLLSLLALMLIYSNMMKAEAVRKWFTIMFSIGIAALIISIIIFSASYLLKYPIRPD